MDKQKVDTLLKGFQKLNAEEKKHFLQELICPQCEIDYTASEILDRKHIELKKRTQNTTPVKHYCCIHDFFAFLQMTKEESQMFREALELYQKN